MKITEIFTFLIKDISTLNREIAHHHKEHKVKQDFLYELSKLKIAIEYENLRPDSRDKYIKALARTWVQFDRLIFALTDEERDHFFNISQAQVNGDFHDAFNKLIHEDENE